MLFVSSIRPSQPLQCLPKYPASKRPLGRHVFPSIVLRAQAFVLGLIVHRIIHLPTEKENCIGMGQGFGPQSALDVLLQRPAFVDWCQGVCDPYAVLLQ